MTLDDARALLWFMAVLFGLASFVPLALVQLAHRRFRELLKAPLDEEVERRTHLWEGRINRWTFAGMAASGLSIACFVAWLVASLF